MCKSNESFANLSDPTLDVPGLSYAQAELDILLSLAEQAGAKAVIMQQCVNNRIMELASAFLAQQNDENSARYIAMSLLRLAELKPLSPLTGEDSEWELISDMAAISTYQNKRYGYIFKNVNKLTGKVMSCYDVSGIFCSEDGGHNWFVSADYRKSISFPYLVPDEPELVYLRREENGERTVITDPEEILRAYESYTAASSTEVSK